MTCVRLSQRPNRPNGQRLQYCRIHAACRTARLTHRPGDEVRARRAEHEAAVAADKDSGGVIWKAFQRTGCGVAIDGHLKEQIDPINLRGTASGLALTRSRSALLPPWGRALTHRMCDV